MIHEDNDSLNARLQAAGLQPDARRMQRSAISDELVDDLVFTAVFSGNDETREYARQLIHRFARALGAVPSSIQSLYEAMGRGEVQGFTVPAHNIRILTYDTARALFRAAIKGDVGAFIFEIARSEIGYTEQRPSEYAACVLGAAIRESFTGPVFIQGDHFQASVKRWTGGEQDKERQAIESLIDEAIAAEFYNIDIDTSTLVDLSYATLDEQQHANYANCAHFTRYIRQREPQGITISVGGEIGEVGKENTTPDEFRAYMEGYLRSLGSGMKGISKVSIQTGTSHGGVVLPDGSVAEARIDFGALRAISDVARREYGLAGAVQHGASTLPEDVFDEFPRSDTAEIHLATGFQNMVFDHPAFPADLKDEISVWLHENAASERKQGETEEQFIYKTRKKSIGPFKRRMWDLPANTRQQIIGSLEAKFSFLFAKLSVTGTKKVVAQHVRINESGPFVRSAAPAQLSEIPEGEGE
ncbi:MAG: class II fructose-bisphosphate aldolase [Acidobacteriota bacterium]